MLNFIRKLFFLSLVCCTSLYAVQKEDNYFTKVNYGNLYPNNLKNCNLGSAKAQGFDLPKSTQYYNMGSISEVESRELWLEPKTNFSGCLGINAIDSIEYFHRDAEGLESLQGTEYFFWENTEQGLRLSSLAIEDSKGNRARAFYFYDESGCIRNVTFDNNSEVLDIADFQETIAFDSICQQVSDYLISWYCYLKTAAKNSPSNINQKTVLPAPFNQTLEQLGQGFLGNLQYLLMGCHPTETRIGSHGKRDLHDKVRVTFINGMLNTEDMVIQALESISASHGDVKVSYVFRPTGGWTGDLGHALMIKSAYMFGYRSTHAYLLANLWKELIREMGGVEGGGTIVHYAHSLGGSDTDRARTLLTPEEQKMIRVITFGSATFVSNTGYQSVTNIVSKRDFICIVDPLGRMRNYWDPQSNIQYFAMYSPWTVIDHFLSGPTYAQVLKDLGKKFLEEFNQRLIQEDQT